jgi:Kef-type K+ transport system membrane component KefB
MFLVGLQTRTEHIRFGSATAVSLAGMVVPFALGSGLAVWFLKTPGLFAPGVRTSEACLYLGASMAITAFPILARILDERGLTGTPLGSLAMSAGAADDAAAWCVLAFVLASFGGGAGIAIRAIIGGTVYALVLLTVGRRLLAPLGTAAATAGRVTPSILGITLTLFMLGAFAMDAAGLHVVFGGYLLGVAMPRGIFARDVCAQLEPFAVVALIPIFFTYSGLTTRLDMFNSLEVVGVVAAVLAAAFLGKLGACWAAARLMGEDNRTALAVGTLMNARGLMELIILNIGIQHGLIQPLLFSVMVVMAIVTTFMTTPLFELVYGRFARAAGRYGETGRA